MSGSIKAGMAELLAKGFPKAPYSTSSTEFIKVRREDPLYVSPELGLAIKRPEAIWSITDTGPRSTETFSSSTVSAERIKEELLKASDATEHLGTPMKDATTLTAKEEAWKDNDTAIRKKIGLKASEPERDETFGEW